MKNLLILQVDGLSHNALRYGVSNGLMPTVKKLLENGWNLKKIYCGIPSTTPASQMELFYGINDLIPNFRFYIKEKGLVFSPENPSVVALMDKEALEKNPNPLMKDGVVIMGLFPGGSQRSIYMGLRNLKNKNLRASLLFVLNPVRLVMSFLKVIIMYFIEKAEHKKDKRKINSHMSRFLYVLQRLFEEVLIGELAFHLVKKEIKEKAPVIFVNFFGYDEITHHYGPKSLSSRYYLPVADLYLKSCLTIAEKSGIPYEIVILSDHGQTESMPIAQGYDGKTLGQKIKELYPSKSLYEHMAGHISAPKDIDLHIMNSGGLSLIYDAKTKNTLTRAEIEKNYPDFCSKLSKIPGVGYIVVRENGKNIAVKDGKSFPLDYSHARDFLSFIPEEEVEWSIGALNRLANMKYSGDILVFGAMTKEDDCICFEYQGGAHGSIGGDQTRAFFLSKNIDLDSEKVVDLADVYTRLYGYIYEDKG